MTPEQTKLIEAIAWRLRDSSHYADLLSSAAREVGMTNNEAILALDAIVDEEASKR